MAEQAEGVDVAAEAEQPQQVTMGDLRRAILADAAAAGLTPEVAAFMEFFGPPVLVQLRQPLVAAAFGGRWVQGHQGARFGLIDVARDDEGMASEVDAIACNMMPDQTGSRISLVMATPERMLTTTVSPAEILYVTRVEPSPAPPQASRIVMP